MKLMPMRPVPTPLISIPRRVTRSDAPAFPLMPLQLPLHVPAPPQATRLPTGVPFTTLHLPTFAPRLQAEHCAVQALLQHTPSTQKPDWHCAPTSQAAPSVWSGWQVGRAGHSVGPACRAAHPCWAGVLNNPQCVTPGKQSHPSESRASVLLLRHLDVTLGAYTHHGEVGVLDFEALIPHSNLGGLVSLQSSLRTFPALVDWPTKVSVSLP